MLARKEKSNICRHRLQSCKELDSYLLGIETPIVRDDEYLL